MWVPIREGSGAACGTTIKSTEVKYRKNSSVQRWVIITQKGLVLTQISKTMAQLNYSYNYLVSFFGTHNYYNTLANFNMNSMF